MGNWINSKLVKLFLKILLAVSRIYNFAHLHFSPPRTFFWVESLEQLKKNPFCLINSAARLSASRTIKASGGRFFSKLCQRLPGENTRTLLRLFFLHICLTQILMTAGVCSFGGSKEGRRKTSFFRGIILHFLLLPIVTFLQIACMTFNCVAQFPSQNSIF